MKMNRVERLFLDVHAIQTLPPSNVNRDDTGSPKTAQYGGVRRARVSSQSWKRAMRKYFLENSEESNVGVRTREIVKYISDKIINLKPNLTEEEAMNLAEKALNDAKITTKDQKSKALFFLGNNQAENIAKLAIEGKSNKKELQKILKDNPSIDIALFGRMLADDPSLNEDASSQVAHAISTHGVQTEFDFFTAVDDLAPEDNAGAGMLGTIEYNSSTLYRYANIALHEFASQLEDKQATINSVKLFVEAFVKSMPTGKINTFANQSLPQGIIVTLRSDRPVNLVSAFETPVKSSEGYVEKSIKKLFEEYNKVQKIAEEPEFNSYLLLDDYSVEPIGVEANSLKDLISNLESELVNILPEKGE